MSKKYTFTILGGDRRYAGIAKRLLSFGHTVRICGLDAPSADIAGAELFLSPDKAMLGCDVIILPLPVSRDNIFLNFIASDNATKLTLADIVKSASKNANTIITGGIIPVSMAEMCQKLGVRFFDYYAVEELQKKNALPSAEGAVMLAMENTEKNIEGSHALIGGYGRIGKILAHKLKVLGAEVTVAARRDEVLCEIALGGCNAINTSDIEAMSCAVSGSDVIFNTSPGIIFTKQILEKAHAKPIYIEIASAPGGIDIPSARECGLQMIFAPSIPGKYAPVSAGDYILETIFDFLELNGGTEI